MGGTQNFNNYGFQHFFTSKTAIESSIYNVGLRKFLVHNIKYCKAGEEASISYKPVLPFLAFLPFYNTSMLPYYYEYIT